jgi:ATP adenylyltransferase
MEFVWSPWRYDYMTSVGKTMSSSCVFCLDEDTSRDADKLIVHRGSHNFVILNLFPYTSGHFMVAPYVHTASFDEAPPEQVTEMMALAQRGIRALKGLYHPEGFNIGLNLGHCAGAGIREHFHLHVVPRWIGDANFMGITSETRVLPEELFVTRRRLSEVF